ncbi:helix-turn-helix domain-containing protein [Bradyrhizobium barranii]|uniref:helix-turn-helix domain-containing protein n=1 Tax=Bradyrhizobium barranii TaxID=2992140 RepID=UPI003CCB0414
MKVQKKTPLTPSRGDGASVVEGGLSKADAACQFNTTPKTIAKWVKRFRRKCRAARERSSSPTHRRARPRQPVQGHRDVAPAGATQASKSQAKWTVRHQPEDAAELLSC